MTIVSLYHVYMNEHNKIIFETIASQFKNGIYYALYNAVKIIEKSLLDRFLGVSDGVYSTDKETSINIFMAGVKKELDNALQEMNANT